MAHVWIKIYKTNNDELQFMVGASLGTVLVPYYCCSCYFAAHSVYGLDFVPGCYCQGSLARDNLRSALHGGAFVRCLPDFLVRNH